MGRPTLSYCLATAGPPARVQALLELVRPHVDEIVLAVDRRGDVSTLDAGADLADRRMTFEMEDSSSRLYGWMRHQCNTDWILRLDDDEVPGTALLEALPELIADRNVTHYDLRRRWLYGGRDRYLACPPWSVEFQKRLLRNLPAVWRPGGPVHDIGDTIGDRRLLDFGFYHCDLIIKPLAVRRRKGLLYESLRPGLQYGAFPLNSMYLPEDYDGLCTAFVPPEDLRLIDAVLDHSLREPGAHAISAGAPVEGVSAADVAAYSKQDQLAPAAYRAAVAPVAVPEDLPAATVWHFEVLVTNQGDARWPAGEHSDPRIRVGFRWRDSAGKVLHEGRALFPETVAPGRTTRVLAETITPVEPGPHRLEIDLVHEHVRWFGCQETVEIAVERPELARFPRFRPRPIDDELVSQLKRLRAQTRAANRRAEAVERVAASRRYRVVAAVAAPVDQVRRRMSGRR